MAFRIDRNARAWFKDVRPRLKIDFDYYYLCLMAGIASNRKKTIPAVGTDELIQGFPVEYKPRSGLIISLMLKTELQQMGIGLEEREAVHNFIRRYLNIDSSSRLTDEGERALNDYANGGFEALSEVFDSDRPRTLEGFLQLYKKFIDRATSGEVTSL